MDELVLSPEKDPTDLSSDIPVEPLVAPDSVPTEHSPAEINTPCRFFLEGRCRFGARCRNHHPGDTGSACHLEDPRPTHNPFPQLPLGKKPAMKTAEDVISRLLWDTQVPAEHFSIGYLDRFLGILEEPFTAFSWEDLASAGPGMLAIPKHRIQYFKYKTLLVWDKVSRTDDVFGSTGSGRTILEVIKEEEEAAVAIKEKRAHGRSSNGDREKEMGVVGPGMIPCSGEETNTGLARDRENQTNRRVGAQDIVKALGKSMDNLELVGGTRTILDEKVMAKETEREVGDSVRDGHSIKEGEVPKHIFSITEENDPSMEDEENLTLQSREWVHFPHSKQRPTHFIAIQVTSPEIQEAVKRFQGALSEIRPDLAKFCVPLATLHLTLCVLCLDTPEKIYKAFAALQELRANSQRLLPPALLLSFHRVETFHSHVLYMAPANTLELGLLARTLENAFNKKDVTVIHPPDKEKFHLTMVKIPSGKAELQLPTDSSWIPTINDLGTQAVEALCLCEVGKGRRTDGFYTTVLKVDLF
ncbi:leukocyte receptor cluster member 9 [Rhineura floridana]|uniref:leukocyte receptor cluster member 9 n=1 Tax=Rhineura floridana TaxID=261503 RepID=UPI002AC816ED|nr:leukocyte receptor cluster member 9 [Rhineura floridana]